MKDIFKLLLMLGFIIYSGFKSDGISGIFESLNSLLTIEKEMLGLLNIFSVLVTGDGILTQFFLHYIACVIVGLLFELFNIKKGCFGKLFSKASYWLICIPVSLILNYFSSMIFG